MRFKKSKNLEGKFDLTYWWGADVDWQLLCDVLFTSQRLWCSGFDVLFTSIFNKYFFYDANNTMLGWIFNDQGSTHVIGLHQFQFLLFIFFSYSFSTSPISSQFHLPISSTHFFKLKYHLIFDLLLLPVSVKVIWFKLIFHFFYVDFLLIFIFLIVDLFFSQDSRSSLRLTKIVQDFLFLHWGIFRIIFVYFFGFLYIKLLGCWLLL